MRKMDEMEQKINERSIKYSWLFGIAALAILSIYRAITHNVLGIGFIIMLTMLIIYRISSFIQHSKKGNKEASNVLVWVIITIVLTLILGFFIGRYL